MGRLNGKVAIVTGAGRGIGRATAKLLAAEGAKVAVLSLTPENVDSVVADIQAAGGTALGVVCDVSDADQINAAVDKVVATYERIDILVNVAFDPSSVSSSVADLSVEQLQRNFETGPVAICGRCRPAIPTSRPAERAASSTSPHWPVSSAWWAMVPMTWRRRRYAP